jgi:hypothetical protein
MPRSQLKTSRFNKSESKLIDDYLKHNPIFESFSSLARVATLQFINEKKKIDLNQVAPSKRPSFLWDYDLSEYEVREILDQLGLSDKKKWLIERILTQARFSEIFSYLDVKAIQSALPYLRLDPKIRERWQHSLQRWGCYV